MKCFNQQIAISAFVYPVVDKAITSLPFRLSWIQDSIIRIPGHIMSGGVGSRPSAEIHSMIVTDLRFSGLGVYSSLTRIGTTTSSPLGHPIRTPDSSILWIFLALRILYLSRLYRYFSNHSSKSLSVCVSTRFRAIGFVLMV